LIRIYGIFDIRCLLSKSSTSTYILHEFWLSQVTLIYDASSNFKKDTILPSFKIRRGNFTFRISALNVLERRVEMRIAAIKHSLFFIFYINGYQEKEKVEILFFGNGDASYVNG